MGARDDVTGSANAKMAMHELCVIYWRPLYSFSRRSGYSKEDAEDLTQDFLAQVIAKRHLHRAEQDKGRLRSFLLSYLKHFLSDRRKAANAQKRGGGKEIVLIDQEAESRYLAELADTSTPEVVFEKTWALTLLEHVLLRIEAEFQAEGKGELFAALKPTLQWGGRDGSGMAEIANRMGMQEGAVKVAAFRLRKRYRQALREEVTSTLVDGEDVDEEMRYLFELLSR